MAYLPITHQVAVAVAVQVERDRCIEIARSLISTDPDWDSSQWNQACERIAMAIEMGAEVRPTRNQTRKPG